jgi:hypothetical protein
MISVCLSINGLLDYGGRFRWHLSMCALLTPISSFFEREESLFQILTFIDTPLDFKIPLSFRLSPVAVGISDEPAQGIVSIPRSSISGQAGCLCTYLSISLYCYTATPMHSLSTNKILCDLMIKILPINIRYTSFRAAILCAGNRVEKSEKSAIAHHLNTWTVLIRNSTRFSSALYQNIPLTFWPIALTHVRSRYASA